MFRLDAGMLCHIYKNITCFIRNSQYLHSRFTIYRDLTNEVKYMFALLQIPSSPRNAYLGYGQVVGKSRDILETASRDLLETEIITRRSFLSSLLSLIFAKNVNIRFKLRWTVMLLHNKQTAYLVTQLVTFAPGSFSVIKKLLN